MKKYAVICPAAMLAFMCVFKMTDRAAAQGKAGAAPLALPEINKENIRAPGVWLPPLPHVFHKC